MKLKLSTVIGAAALLTTLSGGVAFAQNNPGHNMHGNMMHGSMMHGNMMHGNMMHGHDMHGGMMHAHPMHPMMMHHHMMRHHDMHGHRKFYYYHGHEYVMNLITGLRHLLH